MSEGGSAPRCKSCGQVLHRLATSLYAPWDSDRRFAAPLYERLAWYQWESAEELALVRAMVEHCSSGETLWVSVPRLAAYSKIAERRIQELLHGKPRREMKHGEKRWRTLATPGLISRHILSVTAPHSAYNSRPSTYRLNEAVLELDRAMMSILEKSTQIGLPGITRPSVPGDPIPFVNPVAAPVSDTRVAVYLPPGANVAPGGDRDGNPLVRTSQEGGANVAPGVVRTSHQAGANVAPELLHIDPSNNYSSTTTTILDLKAAAEMLATDPPGVTPSGVDMILANVLAVRPDVSTAEFEDRLRHALKSKHIESWSGFFVACFADEFRGERFQQVRAAVKAATQAAVKAATQAATKAATQAATKVATQAAVEAKRQQERTVSRGGNPWEKVLKWLAGKISQNSFNTWLAPTRYDHAAGPTLFVRVPSSEFCHIGERYGDLISEAIEEMQLDFREIEFMSSEDAQRKEASDEG